MHIHCERRTFVIIVFDPSLLRIYILFAIFWARIFNQSQKHESDERRPKKNDVLKVTSVALHIELNVRMHFFSLFDTSPFYSCAFPSLWNQQRFCAWHRIDAQHNTADACNDVFGQTAKRVFNIVYRILSTCCDFFSCSVRNLKKKINYILAILVD